MRLVWNRASAKTAKHPISSTSFCSYSHASVMSEWWTPNSRGSKNIVEDTGMSAREEMRWERPGKLRLSLLNFFDEINHLFAHRLRSYQGLRWLVHHISRSSIDQQDLEWSTTFCTADKKKPSCGTHSARATLNITLLGIIRYSKSDLTLYARTLLLYLDHDGIRIKIRVENIDRRRTLLHEMGVLKNRILSINWKYESDHVIRSLSWRNSDNLRLFRSIGQRSVHFRDKSGLKLWLTIFFQESRTSPHHDPHQRAYRRSFPWIECAKWRISECRRVFCRSECKWKEAR